MQLHDGGYGMLFQNRTIFRQLIETFVDEPWVKELNFSQAETVETTFIDEDYRQTESDLIYRLRLRDQEIYFYILMEFQSTVDPWMALRFANYITNFYMALVKIRNIVSTLFLAEAHYDINLLLDELGQIFRTEKDHQAVALFINWFRQLAVHGRIENDDFGKVEAE